MKRRKKALNINFLLFLIGRMVSDTGTSVQLVVMPLYIIDAGGSAVTVGFFSFLSLLPMLLVFPFAGVLGDRMNRKAIMVVTDTVSACVILGLAFMSYMGEISITLLLMEQRCIQALALLWCSSLTGSRFFCLEPVRC